MNPSHTLVSLSNILYYKCFSSPRGKHVNGYLLGYRLIVYEKSFGELWLPRLCTHQGAEKDYRDYIGPLTRGGFHKKLRLVLSRVRMSCVLTRELRKIIGIILAH